MSDGPAGLYLHVPFCARVCPYCDFAVRTGDGARRGRFVEHLLREIELYADYPLEFDTIYLGGGTPSQLAVDDLDRILEAAGRRLHLRSDLAVFLEANPEDVSAEAVASWRGRGVSTLSLGVQSLDPAELAFLGRQHGPEDARRAVGQALEAGFDTVSVDLIYGLPGQEPAAWRRALGAAVALEAQHLSCYPLTIHRGTRFGLLEQRGLLRPLPADEQGELFRLTHRVLNDSGYAGYEVSNFAAAPRHRSRHNVKYWDHTPYLGLGPSAHSFHDGRRSWNVRGTDPWEERIAGGERPIEGSETLDTEALALESLMLGLRTYDGVDLRRLRERYGVDLAAANEALLARLITDGLLSIAHDHLIPTLAGLAVADGLAARFELRPGLATPTEND